MESLPWAVRSAVGCTDPTAGHSYTHFSLLSFLVAGAITKCLKKNLPNFNVVTEKARELIFMKDPDFNAAL